MGKGSFGKVYLASTSGLRGHPEKMCVAVKCIKSGVSSDSHQVKQFAAEMETMASIGGHINIVSVLGVIIKGIGIPYPNSRLLVYNCRNFTNFVRRRRDAYP